MSIETNPNPLNHSYSISQLFAWAWAKRQNKIK